MNNLRKKVLMMTMAAATLSAIAQQPVDYVNPIIGTNGMGHTFPGACTPFGWVQLSPDTDTIPHNVNGAYQKNAYEYCAGYQYRDKTIVGFSHTHLSGTGHSDLGDILLMPAVGDVKLNPGRADYPEEGYRSRFDHATEKAVPGYYEVMLDDYGIKAQLTATQRTGIHKYTFPKGKDGHLILDLVHGIYNYDGKVLWANLRVENDTLLTGYRITNGWARTNYTYFAISLSQPIKDYGYKDKEKVLYNGFWRRFKLEKNFPEITGRKIVAYFNFDTANNSELVVKVALSAVSTEGAIKNLHAEASGKSFEQLAEAARTDWNSELEHFEIEGTPDQKAMFYTSLYHTMINPSVYMDVDGSYRGLDHNIHRAEGFTNYTIFSLWDTYRAEHPFLNLVKPGRNADMVESMIKHEQQSVHGMLPIWSLMGNENWCMSGYHAVSVLADAITKGVFSNVDEALAAMVSTSTVPYYEGIADYMKLGYIPLDKSGTAASSTLEYAYDDWCISIFAEAMSDFETKAKYERFAKAYEFYFDKSTRFMRGLDSKGEWRTPFNPRASTHRSDDYCEGTAWQWTWFVPHDVEGLVNLMGGEDAFVQKLDSLFSADSSLEGETTSSDISGLIGQYAHGNEPSHHVIHLYNYVNHPWRTQELVDSVYRSQYTNSIDGLSGNEDCGQMSAWYILNSMGFYQVCPGKPVYSIGRPAFDKAVINLPEGKTFSIVVKNNGKKNKYIESVLLNGKALNIPFFNHQDIANGGTMEIKMTDHPTKWGVLSPALSSKEEE